VTFTVEDVVERLEDAGVRLDRGLTDADVKRIEKKYAFTFGPDQRALLRAALPLGDAWLNWRHATPANIRERLARPVDGVVSDVLDRDFWPSSWGPRPDQANAAERVARERLALVPTLVPLYGESYLPAVPVPAGAPVFSVSGSSIGLAAADLLAYIVAEFSFSSDGVVPGSASALTVPFWSDRARGAPGADL
jgi:hypothetical protein